MWKICFNGNHRAYVFIEEFWKTPFGSTGSDTRKENETIIDLITIGKRNPSLQDSTGFRTR